MYKNPEEGQCPECGEPTVCNEVDIGVGIQHSPSWCNYCGWNQEDEIKETMENLGLHYE